MANPVNTSYKKATGQEVKTILSAEKMKKPEDHLFSGFSLK